MAKTARVESFEGDRGASEERLRKLTELAIQNLPTERINLASYHLAVYLDVDANTLKYSRRMSSELHNEHNALETWWNEEGRRLVS